MKAEIISVGTEILLGDIVNTNAQYLSRELASIGIEVYHQSVVGDNENRLLSEIKNAFKKTKEYFARRIDAMLSHGELNEDFYEELEELLISSDVGVSSSLEIVENLRLYAIKNKIRTAEK